LWKTEKEARKKNVILNGEEKLSGLQKKRGSVFLRIIERKRGRERRGKRECKHQTNLMRTMGVRKGTLVIKEPFLA